MFENYVDVIEASKILDVHPETVKRLIREGKLTAAYVPNASCFTIEYETCGRIPNHGREDLSDNRRQ